MKKIFAILIVLGTVWGCSDFNELNIDTKNPVSVPGEPLYTNATRDLVDLMADVNVNRNVFKLYSQYWAQTTYPDESQYNMVSRKNPDTWWRILYRDVLMDYSRAAEIIKTKPVVGTAAEKTAIQSEIDNKIATIEVMQVYAYSVLVDLFGDVPYTEALNPDNVLPKYDAAADVYTAIITKLDAAIAKFKPGYASYTEVEDLVYGGDVDAWVSFANSLKLRLALRIADADNAKAKSLAEAAASKVFSSNADNFAMTYYGAAPNTNPMWEDLVQSGRLDFIPANTAVEKFTSLNDPRSDVFFSEKVGGVYLGGVYGSANAASSFSQLGAVFSNPELKGTLLSYAEVEFLLAEAKERGYAVSGTAASHYEAGIIASCEEWGLSGMAVSDYLAQTSVAYATAAGDWKQKIGTQKWMAFYNQGFDGWNVIRQFDLGFIKKITIDATLKSTPTRFIYPISEATLNPNEYLKAKAKYDSDSPYAKIFWDKF